MTGLFVSVQAHHDVLTLSPSGDQVLSFVEFDVMHDDPPLGVYEIVEEIVLLIQYPHGGERGYTRNGSPQEGAVIWRFYSYPALTGSLLVTISVPPLLGAIGSDASLPALVVGEGPATPPAGSDLQTVADRSRLGVGGNLVDDPLAGVVGDRMEFV